jgi:hypothetical protein
LDFNIIGHSRYQSFVQYEAYHYDKINLPLASRGMTVRSLFGGTKLNFA